MLTLNKTQLAAIGQAELAPHPGLSLGPALLGMIADLIMFGVVFQLFLHFEMYVASSEKIGTRILVSCLMVLSTIISVYLVAWNMHLFVYNFGSYGPFVENTWNSWFYILDVVARLPVSAFFGLRAWLMTNRSVVLAIILIIINIASAGSTIAAKVIVADLSKIELARDLVFVKSGSDVAGDLITTGCIAWWLYRSRTGWSGTDRILTKLLVMTAETQLPPTIMAATFLAVFAAQNPAPVTAFFACNNKVYTICLLVVLNTKLALGRELMSSDNDRAKNSKTKSTLSPLGSKDTATIEMEPRGQCFDSERQIEDGKTANILPGR